MFDPTKFGGDPSFIKHNGRGTAGAATSSSYTIHNDSKLRFAICPNDMNKMADLFGIDKLDRMFVCPNPDKGSLILWPFDKMASNNGYIVRSITHNGPSSNNKFTGSGTMSIESMREYITTRFGKFNHVYLAMEVLSGGGGVEFVPTGVRD